MSQIRRVTRLQLMCILIGVNIELNNGTLLEGRYRVLYRIGQGGMGTVYAAEHVMLHRQCAVKVLHSSEADDETMLKRFRIEAQASANIRHPNIVEVMDFGLTADNLPFFVMELLEGESVADRLDREGKLQITRAIELTQQILSGLETAHKKGVVHRDLKPENIYLAQGPDSEVVKILDFGISKIVGGTPSRPPVPVSAKHRVLTQKGVVFGTPGYMAPETLFGAESADGRADLFSVAVLLFEMVIGKRPFQGGDPHSTMMATASQETPKPRELEPSVPRALEEVIVKSLEKDPDKRYQTARELSSALAEAVSKPARAAKPASPKPAGIELEIERDPMASIQSSGLQLDNAYLPPKRTRPRPAHLNREPDLILPKKRARLGTRMKRITIAFSPIPIIFFLGLGGGAYYYFVYRDPVRVITEEDPIAREIARRTSAPSLAEDEVVEDEAPNETVAIWIDSKPAGLTVYWNGEMKFERPLIVPKGDTTGELRFKSPGYEEKTMSIIPNKEQTVSVRLKKLAKRKHSRR